MFVFVYLGVRHFGTLFLRSLYDFLFKNISHHGSFLPLSYKWMDGSGSGIGWDLCAGLFYEHRFAMLIMPTKSRMVSQVGFGTNPNVHLFQPDPAGEECLLAKPVLWL